MKPAIIDQRSHLDTPATGIPHLPSHWVRPISERPNPRQIGNFVITGLLGSGGMGQIFSAYDHRLDRRVAIKMIHPGESHRRDYRQRLRREARLLARIHHPSIVQIYDFLELREGEFIVMELVEGESLRKIARGEKCQSLAKILSIARQVAEGLAAAHQCGVVHRDVKSENVMVKDDGQIKLLDFGLAQDRHGARQKAACERPVMGTLRALSPEQAKGLELDERSDLFALGVLIYELLTGESPFLSEDLGETLMRICTHQQRPIGSLVPDVPEELCRLLDHLLEKAPDQRPADAASVATRLLRLEMQHCGDELPLPPRPTSISAHHEPTRPCIPSLGASVLSHEDAEASSTEDDF